MTENNLYTVEAFESYFSHLQPDGVLTVTRWYADGLRLISLVQAAGQRLGWPRHRRPGVHRAATGRWPLLSSSGRR